MRLQERLRLQGVQFHFLRKDMGSNRTVATTTTIPHTQQQQHASQCASCFYKHGLEWMDLQTSSSSSNAALSNGSSTVNNSDVQVQLYRDVIKHASVSGYERIAILKDSVVLHRNWNNLLKDHDDYLPTGWKILLLGSHCMDASSSSSTDETRASKIDTSKFYPADIRCVDSTFAFALNGKDVQFEFDHLMQYELQSEKQSVPIHNSIDSVFRTWISSKHSSDAFVIWPNVTIPSFASLQQTVVNNSVSTYRNLANFQREHTLYWNRKHYDDDACSSLASSMWDPSTEPVCRIDVIVPFFPPVGVGSKLKSGAAHTNLRKLHRLVASILSQTYSGWNLIICIPKLPWSTFMSDPLLDVQDTKSISKCLQAVQDMIHFDVASKQRIKLESFDSDIMQWIQTSLFKEDRPSDIVSICNDLNTSYSRTRFMKCMEEFTMVRTNDVTIHLSASNSSKQSTSCEPAMQSWHDLVIRKGCLLYWLNKETALTTYNQLVDAIKKYCSMNDKGSEYSVIWEILSCQPA